MSTTLLDFGRKQDQSHRRRVVALNPEEKRHHEQAYISRIAVASKNLQIVQSPELPKLTTKKRQALQRTTTIDAQPAEESGDDSTPPSVER